MRFFIPHIDKNDIKLTDEAHAHAAHVLRIRPGDYLSVFDGSGNEYFCTVDSISKTETKLDLIETRTDVNETSTDVTLYMSVIKQDRFEIAVQKATELGVKRIVPVYSAYAQHNIRLNTERLQKIAVAACEQCGRSRLPVIEEAIDFNELVERAKSTHMIFPWERELAETLNDAIDKSKSSVAVFIGPEGGITADEKSALADVGAKSVTLGRRILRAETAAISTLSVLMYEMGEWRY